MHKPPSDKLKCNQADEVRAFIFGGYCPNCAQFDEDKLSANPHPPLFVLYSLIIRQFKSFYRTFDGDLILALVMCEIWQYNIGRYLDRAGSENASAVLGDSDNRQKLLPACNAYSLSQVLGVPSETVRRKVRKLIDKGWVWRSEDGELISTLEFENQYPTEVTVEAMREFLSSARHIEAILGSK